MFPSSHWQSVDACSIYPSDQKDGFFIEISQRGQASMRLKFPACVIPQLMRSLPHVDAAIQLAKESGPSTLMAYPLLAWRIEGVESPLQGEAGSLVLQLRDDRFVDTSLELDLDAAIALRQDLDRAIEQARIIRASKATPCASRQS